MDVEFIEVKTIDLIGEALDYTVSLTNHDHGWLNRHVGIVPLDPYSISWGELGPLLDEHDVWFSSDDGQHVASCAPHSDDFIQMGETKLIAGCRAIVAARLGDKVMIPRLLMIRGPYDVQDKAPSA